MNDRVVIIPTYNEKENIENILRYVFKLEPKFDVLVIEDNSPDGTAQIVKRLQSEFPQLHMMRISPIIPMIWLNCITPAKAGKAIWRSVPVTSQALTS